MPKIFLFSSMQAPKKRQFFYVLKMSLQCTATVINFPIFLFNSMQNAGPQKETIFFSSENVTVMYCYRN